MQNIFLSISKKIILKMLKFSLFYLARIKAQLLKSLNMISQNSGKKFCWKSLAVSQIKPH